MSAPEAPAEAPVRAVPRRLRMASAAAAVVVLAVLVVAGLLLKRPDGGVVSFHTSDQVAMVVLGLILAAGLLLLGRPVVEADATEVRVRNLVGSHRIPWALVRAVRFERNAQCASLALTSGEEVTLLAVQAVDKERAVHAVEGLRALLAAARGPVVPEPPRLYDD